jgi:hypothetical protein
MKRDYDRRQSALNEKRPIGKITTQAESFDKLYSDVEELLQSESDRFFKFRITEWRQPQGHAAWPSSSRSARPLGRRLSLPSASACRRLREKGGKRHAMPCHHNLDGYLVAYLDGAGLRGDPKGRCSARSGAGKLTRTVRRKRTPTTMIRRRAAAAGGNSPFYFDKPGFSAGVRAGAGGTGDQQVPRLKLRSGIRLHRRSLLSSNAVHDSEGGETMKPTDLASYLHTERDLPLPKTTKETILASQPPGNAGNIG